MALELGTWADLLVKMPSRVRRRRKVGRQAHTMPRDCSTTVQRTAIVMVYSKSAKLAMSRARTRIMGAWQALWMDRSISMVCL